MVLKKKHVHVNHIAEIFPCYIVVIKVVMYQVVMYQTENVNLKFLQVVMYQVI
jgi:hypothetical protein